MRLIDADALRERAIKVFAVKDHWYMKAVGTREIDKAPTIDAAPVVHGKWIFNDDWWEFRCSLCQGAIGNIKKYKFCPNCGARMDGGENNE